MKKLLILLLLPLLASISSCQLFEVRGVKVEGWQPVLALPMINATLTMEDIIAGADTNLVKIESDNSLTLVYSDRLYSFTAKDIIDIPDQLHSDVITLTPSETALLNSVGSVTINRTIPITFDTGGNPAADEILFRTGDFEASMASTFPHDIDIAMTIPAFTKNGQPLQDSYTLDYNGSVPVSLTDQLALNQYLADFNFIAGDNEVDINLNITINTNGNPATGSETFSFSVGLKNMELVYFKGYVGQHHLTAVLDTLNIGLFDGNATATKFHVADPRLRLIFSNGFGVPSEVDLNNITFYDPQQGLMTLSGPGVPSAMNLASPSIAEWGQKKTTELYLDNTNSNIDQIINSTPESLILDIAVETNPTGVKVQNFVIDTVGLDVDVNFELPLHGSITDFVFQDTVPFSLENPEQIIDLLLRTNIENEFPFDVQMQIYLADSNHVIIDSLLAPNHLIVTSGIVNGATGKVINSSHKMTDIQFDQARLNKLPQVAELILQTSISTYNQGATDVKLYADYEVNVKLGVKAQIDAKLPEND